MSMRKFAIVLLIAFAATGAAPKDGCTHTWRKDNFKSYKQVEGEVHNSLGRVKILRIALCSAGAAPYFQVTVLNLSGTVKTVQVPAARN